MSFVIKEMEIPENCYKCPFLDYEEGFCFAKSVKLLSGWYRSVYRPCVSEEKRDANCPIIPLKKEKMMARYIDLYDHRNYYIGEDGEYQKWNIDPEVIEEAADVVEVVRCKDCAYSQGHFTNAPVKCGCGYGTHGEEYFCADGKRRK